VKVNKSAKFVFHCLSSQNFGGILLFQNWEFIASIFQLAFLAWGKVAGDKGLSIDI
jgi:hypothetical protein